MKRINGANLDDVLAAPKRLSTDEIKLVIARALADFIAGRTLTEELVAKRMTLAQLPEAKRRFVVDAVANLQEEANAVYAALYDAKALA